MDPRSLHIGGREAPANRKVLAAASVSLAPWVPLSEGRCKSEGSSVPLRGSFYPPAVLSIAPHPDRSQVSPTRCLSPVLIGSICSSLSGSPLLAAVYPCPHSCGAVAALRACVVGFALRHSAKLRRLAASQIGSLAAVGQAGTQAQTFQDCAPMQYLFPQASACPTLRFSSGALTVPAPRLFLLENSTARSVGAGSGRRSDPPTASQTVRLKPFLTGIFEFVFLFCFPQEKAEK